MSILPDIFIDSVQTESKSQEAVFFLVEKNWQANSKIDTETQRT